MEKKEKKKRKKRRKGMRVTFFAISFTLRPPNFSGSNCFPSQAPDYFFKKRNYFKEEREGGSEEERKKGRKEGKKERRKEKKKERKKERKKEKNKKKKNKHYNEKDNPHHQQSLHHTTNKIHNHNNIECGYTHYFFES